MTSIPKLGLSLGFDANARAAIRARLHGMDRRVLPDDVPLAAVLVPLGHLHGRPAMLFTKRTDTVGTHKGQVSFPGGRMDPTDDDAIHCALRELDEELGVPPREVEVLGVFHDVMSITGLRVTPVLGFLGELDPARFAPRPGEVEDVFTLTLDALVDPARRATQVLGGLRAPYFASGPHPIWGLTALILDEVLREVLELELPPAGMPEVPAPRR
jgi:nudix motif 8